MAGDKWMTSGRNRLKNMQKRRGSGAHGGSGTAWNTGGTRRATRKTAAPAQHPRAVRTTTRAAAAYASYDPMKRRGITVSLRPSPMTAQPNPAVAAVTAAALAAGSRRRIRGLPYAQQPQQQQQQQQQYPPPHHHHQSQPQPHLYHAGAPPPPPGFGYPNNSELPPAQDVPYHTMGLVPPPFASSPQDPHAPGVPSGHPGAFTPRDRGSFTPRTGALPSSAAPRSWRPRPPPESSFEVQWGGVPAVPPPPPYLQPHHEHMPTPLEQLTMEQHQHQHPPQHPIFDAHGPPRTPRPMPERHPNDDFLEFHPPPQPPPWEPPRSAYLKPTGIHHHPNHHMLEPTMMNSVPPPAMPLDVQPNNRSYKDEDDFFGTIDSHQHHHHHHPPPPPPSPMPHQRFNDQIVDHAMRPSRPVFSVTGTPPPPPTMLPNDVLFSDLNPLESSSYRRTPPPPVPPYLRPCSRYQPILTTLPNNDGGRHIGRGEDPFGFPDEHRRPGSRARVAEDSFPHHAAENPYSSRRIEAEIVQQQQQKNHSSSQQYHPDATNTGITRFQKQPQPASDFPKEPEPKRRTPKKNKQPIVNPYSQKKKAALPAREQDAKEKPKPESSRRSSLAETRANRNSKTESRANRNSRTESRQPSATAPRNSSRTARRQPDLPDAARNSGAEKRQTTEPTREYPTFKRLKISKSMKSRSRSAPGRVASDRKAAPSRYGRPRPASKQQPQQSRTRSVAKEPPDGPSDGDSSSDDAAATSARHPYTTHPSFAVPDNVAIFKDGVRVDGRGNSIDTDSTGQDRKLASANTGRRSDIAKSNPLKPSGLENSNGAKAKSPMTKKGNAEGLKKPVERRRSKTTETSMVKNNNDMDSPDDGADSLGDLLEEAGKENLWEFFRG